MQRPTPKAWLVCIRLRRAENAARGGGDVAPRRLRLPRQPRAARPREAAERTRGVPVGDRGNQKEPESRAPVAAQHPPRAPAPPWWRSRRSSRAKGGEGVQRPTPKAWLVCIRLRRAENAARDGGHAERDAGAPERSLGAQGSQGSGTYATPRRTRVVRKERTWNHTAAGRAGRKV